MKRQQDRPVGYLVVSALCLLAHNATLIAADAAGLQMWAALLASFGLVTVIGYGGHTLFTFNQVASIRAFGRYALAMSFNIPAAFLFLWLARYVLGLSMTLAAPLATAASMGLNYLLARRAIAGTFPRKD